MNPYTQYDRVCVSDYQPDEGDEVIVLKRGELDITDIGASTYGVVVRSTDGDITNTLYPWHTVLWLEEKTR